MTRPRIAIVGAGIAGLSAARALAADAQVTLFEAGGHFGGHTHTVDVTLDGITHGVDTGFLVFNERTYPRLVRLFADLEVPRAAADMSFSVQVRDAGLEWSGSSLDSVFAQRTNLLRPAFWSMLSQLLRFNRLATALAQSTADEGELLQPLGAFLDNHRFGAPLRDWYLLPMLGCIWSCPPAQMLQMPVATVVRFCHNHGLLQVRDRPQWYSVPGGARQYVDKLLKAVPDARLRTPVQWVRRLPADGVLVHSRGQDERFDEVVLACHSDQSLALLADASPEERAVLGAIRYQPNRAVLHTDASVLPMRRRAWAAWNYAHSASAAHERARVCLHYLINRLQPLPWRRPVLVSLNPEREPEASQVLGDIGYAHPVFDLGALAAQRALPALQGVRQVWFAGAWTRYGFHEDGLLSGETIAQALRGRWCAPARERAAA